MRLIDPLSGYKVASGLGVIHAAYFIAILILPDSEVGSCEELNYNQLKRILLFTHLVSVVLSIAQFGLELIKKFSLGFSLEMACIFFNQGAIFYS
jgi:hypothetical protein